MNKREWATIEQEYFFLENCCRQLDQCDNCIFAKEDFCALYNITNQKDLITYNEGIIKYWNEHKKF